MTLDQVAAVRSTWALANAASDSLAPQFYERLFALDPMLRHLFRHTDFREQGDKLVQMLSLVVRSLDDLPGLLPELHALGQRHRGYGVAEGHYHTVAAALLDTLSAALGPAFVPDARSAWTEALGVLEAAMQGGTPTTIRS